MTVTTAPPAQGKTVAEHAQGPRQVLLIALGIPLVAALLFVALAWPAVHAGPRDLPVGAVGPAPAIEQLEATLDGERPGAIALRTYADADALAQGVRDREVYGGLVLDPAAPVLLTASAASPAVSQALVELSRSVGAGLSQQAGTPVVVRVRDLVPTSAQDPRAAGLAASALPLTIAGVGPAAALALLLHRRTRAQLLGLAVAVTVSALTVATLLGVWFGTTDGHLLATSAALAAGIGAIGLVVLGLGRLLGRAGVTLAAALALLLGNPLSAAASAPELLPSGWGALGQLLPQGATTSLLRSLVWFDGAGAGGPVLVLLGWSVAGAVLFGLAVVGSLRQPGIRSNGEE